MKRIELTNHQIEILKSLVADEAVKTEEAVEAEKAHTEKAGDRKVLRRNSVIEDYAQSLEDIFELLVTDE